MSLWAIWIGIALGVVILAISLRQRIFSKATFLALTLFAIAIFYPLFTVLRGVQRQPETFAHLGHHLLVVAIFLALSFWVLLKVSRPRALQALAVMILGHGLFDAVILAFAPSVNAGPQWWPEFCAAVDITLGLGLLICQKRDLT